MTPTTQNKSTSTDLEDNFLNGDSSFLLKTSELDHIIENKSLHGQIKMLRDELNNEKTTRIIIEDQISKKTIQLAATFEKLKTLQLQNSEMKATQACLATLQLKVSLNVIASRMKLLKHTNFS